MKAEINLQKKKFDDMFNALVNGTNDPIATTTKPTTTSTTNGTKTNSKAPPALTIDDSIFASLDMDDFSPTTKKPPVHAQNNTVGGGKDTHHQQTNGQKKDILDELFQDELFASIVNNPANHHMQPTATKSKPIVAKKNSIPNNRYEDIFSGIPAPTNKNNTNNMDWLENEGTLTKFLTFIHSFKKFKF